MHSKKDNKYFKNPTNSKLNTKPVTKKPYHLGGLLP